MVKLVCGNDQIQTKEEIWVAGVLCIDQLDINRFGYLESRSGSN